MRTTMRRIVAIAFTGALAAAGLAACTPLTQPDGSDITGVPTAPETPLLGSPFLWADGSAISVTPHKLELAQTATTGTGYTEYFSTRALKTKKKAFTPLGVDSSGALAGVLGTRRTSQEITDTGELMDPGSMRMGRYTPESFVPFTTAAGSSAEYTPQVLTGGSVTDQGTAWGEFTEDGQGNRGWKVLGVSPGSTQVRVLASSTPPQGHAAELGFVSLRVTSLVDGRVYWHTGTQSTAADYPDYQMLSVDFTHPGEPRVEALQTSTSAPGKQGVVAASLKSNDQGSLVAQAVTAYIPGAEPQEILRLEKLPFDGQGLELLGADDRGLSVFYDGDLFLIDPETRSAEMFRGPYRSGVSGFVQCGAKVSWSFEQEMAETAPERYVYDRDVASVQVIRGSAMLGAGSCSGDFMSWSEHRPASDDLVPWNVVIRRGE